MGLLGSLFGHENGSRKEMYGGRTEKEMEQLAYRSDHSDAEAADTILQLVAEHGLNTEEYNRIRENVYRPRAKKGDPDAQYWMGLLTAEDAKESCSWYRLAADQGNTKAMKALAQGYSEAANQADSEVPGFGREPEKELCWSMKAAEAGDPEAMCSAGRCYEKGIGTEKSEEQALAWYRKAAEQQRSEAWLLLAGLYGDPAGMYYEPAEAVACCEKVTEKGEAETVAKAAQLLGRLYGSFYLDEAARNELTNGNRALYWLYQAFVLEDESMESTTKDAIFRLCNAAGLSLPTQALQQQWRREALERLSYTEKSLGECDQSAR